MTNDYSPATPPWLQTPLPEPSNGRPVRQEEPAPRQEEPQRREEESPSSQRPAESPRPESHRPEMRAESPRPDTRFTESAPPPWQRNGFGSPSHAADQSRPQAQVPQHHLQQPPAQQQAQQPPLQQAPVSPPQAGPQQHAAPPRHQQEARSSAPVMTNSVAYQPNPESMPREKSEIGTDGTVRRVPFQEDRVAQMYQAPADLPPSNPVYTWSPPQQHGPGQWQGAPQSPPAQSVNDLSLLRRAKRPPRSGWRLAVHRASGGSINPGESNADVAYRELVDRVNQPVRGDYRIAILSLKGGVGKTTTTIGLGSTFASLRGDRVIAIDANPDLGTLAHRVPKQTNSTVRALLDDGSIHRYSDVRAHTSQAPSRLEVLASEQDPAVSEAFSEADYRAAIDILQSYYNIILTDCGTGLMHSAMTGVLDMASALVLVTSPAIDGARSASATLDWLEHHGYGKLVERTVVVVNSSRKGASSVDIDQLRKLFLDRTRAVAVVPFDDHLAEGAEIDLELVSKPTRRALLELAATVADEFQR